jgi:hypothetical protein
LRDSFAPPPTHSPTYVAGLGAALDRRDARGAFRISKQPEFLFSEEALVHRRSWSENLTYYTGLGYLSGEVHMYRDSFGERYESALLGKHEGGRLARIGMASTQRVLRGIPAWASACASRRLPRRWDACLGFPCCNSRWQVLTLPLSLAGALLGGGRGAAQALSAPVALAGVEATQRLRLNQLLNSSGKMGRSAGGPHLRGRPGNAPPSPAMPWSAAGRTGSSRSAHPAPRSWPCPAGNALGVLGLLFASFESFAGYLSNGQLPDEANTLAAGAATGALYRSVRGPRQAAAAAVVGAAGGAALLAARKLINPGL